MKALQIKNPTLNLVVRLGIVTAVAGLILGLVYTVTRGPITREEERRNQTAMRAVLPDAELFTAAQVPAGHPSVLAVALGHKADKIIGTDVTVTTQGYGGPVTLMVGIDAQGVVQGMKVLSHTETPGLGANAVTPWFQARFKGAFGRLVVVKHEVKPGDEPKLDADTTATPKSGTTGTDLPAYSVQAITGATITSRAVSKAVNDALTLFRETLKGEMTR